MLITAVDVLVVLLLQHRGFRYLEAMVAGLVFLIGGCFAYELLAAQPAVGAMLGGLIPSPQIITNPSALYIAIGILGATVIPHNLYLHSSIVRKRAPTSATTRASARRSHSPRLTSTVSLLFAFFINAAICDHSGGGFLRSTEHANIADIHDATNC